MRGIRCSLRSMTRRPWSRAPWRTGSSSTSGCRASARRSSLPSEMFERLFVPEELREGFSDGAWLQAMLDVERALAAAEARGGSLPGESSRAPRSRRAGGGRRRRRAVRPPQRDEPGHPRHGVHARGETRGRHDPRIAGGSLWGVRAARRGAPCDADDRPDATPAGAADDVRAQGRRVAPGCPRGSGAAASDSRGTTRRAARRPSRNDGIPAGEAALGGARTGRARGPVAHQPRPDRRGRLRAAGAGAGGRPPRVDGAGARAGPRRLARGVAGAGRRTQLCGRRRRCFAPRGDRARRAPGPDAGEPRGERARLRRRLGGGTCRSRVGRLQGGRMSDDGMRIRREILGDEHVDEAVERTTPDTTDFQDLITRYAWGEIWARPGLDRRTRSAITLMALVALNRERELAMHIRAALRNGLTREEITEVLLQSAIYCGVPAANGAFAVFRDVMEEET